MVNSDMKYYIIYKTINDINGMFYYGKHSTNDLNDDYLGSGVYLNRAIEKYGKEHFHREVVCILNSEKEMNDKEKEIVTEELVKNPMCYNLMLGGEGGDTWSGRKHSQETKDKLSNISNKNWKSQEYRNKVSLGLSNAWIDKKINHPLEYKELLRKRGSSVSKALRGKHKSMTEEHKKSISQSLKKYHESKGHSPCKQSREFHCDKNNICGKMTYVTNGDIEYRIYIEELDWFLSNGWKNNRCPSLKKSKAKTQQAMDSASGRGKLIVHNSLTKEVKRIKPEELQSYLDKGWDRGYLNRKKRI